MQQSFDLRTHIRDPKSGKVLQHQPYVLIIEGGQRKFERPVGSGNYWTEGGQPIGEHKEWTAPLTEDQKVLKALTERDQEIARLKTQLAERELQAIKTEKPEPTEKIEAKGGHKK